MRAPCLDTLWYLRACCRASSSHSAPFASHSLYHFEENVETIIMVSVYFLKSQNVVK